MDIVVSSPGSPGTSLTDNVKDQIITIFDVLQENEDFNSTGELRRYLEKNHNLKQTYTRNILSFLQNCGIVGYQNIECFENDKFFTNIGKAYVDILKCIKKINREEDIDKDVLKKLQAIEKAIYFQCLVLMMKNKDCNYAQDFFDVLRFVEKYDSIDSTEYLLIQHARGNFEGDYIGEIADIVNQYRQNQLVVNVYTKTKNNEKGDSKSVNSFPYVTSNFSKSGVFVKDDSGRYRFNQDRSREIKSAIKEVSKIWENSVQKRELK